MSYLLLRWLIKIFPILLPWDSKGRSGVCFVNWREYLLLVIVFTLKDYACWVATHIYLVGKYWLFSFWWNLEENLSQLACFVAVRIKIDIASCCTLALVWQQQACFCWLNNHYKFIIENSEGDCLYLLVPWKIGQNCLDRVGVPLSSRRGKRA